MRYLDAKFDYGYFILFYSFRSHDAFFADIKKTIKGEFVEAAIKLEKSYTKSSDIQTISLNSLKTVKHPSQYGH